jgi:hypothetical protein
MNVSSLKSEIAYIRQLVDAGWNGAHSIRPSAPVLTQALYASVVIGSAIGVFTALLRKRRRPGSVGSYVVVGGALGLCAGAMWETRTTVGAATRAAIRQINSARDIHWLQKHPIAYG